MMLINDCYRHQNGKSLRNIRSLFPEFTVTLPRGFRGNDKRYLFPLSTTKHSKKRVYTDTTVDVRPENLFLSYLSTRDIDKLSLNDQHACSAWGTIHSRFGNRWCLTLNRPARKYNKLSFLLHNLIATSETSTSNNPPLGEYSIGPDIDWMLATDPISRSKIVCTVSKTVDILDQEG